ncbi:hypothetical protein ZWY2020_042880 [Hordeum vulgare]|nr:hypothetical protein ZWY2020_042880 [Hordeum vulgare]
MRCSASGAAARRTSALRCDGGVGSCVTRGELVVRACWRGMAWQWRPDLVGTRRWEWSPLAAATATSGALLAGVKALQSGCCRPAGGDGATRPDLPYRCVLRVAFSPWHGGEGAAP